MKFSILKLFGAARPGLRFLPAGLLLLPMAVFATDQTYINTGTIIGTPPQVDAINFFNSGTWSIATPGAPYETANTQTYTNKSSMFGAPGWEFDLGPSIFGSRTNLSTTFYNDSGATIQAGNSTVISLPGVTSGGSFLLVQATNIINRGNLIATPYGQIKLVGQTVNLSRSFLEIPPITGAGSANGQTNFSPDTAIYDEYWGAGVTNIFTPGVWSGTTASASAFPNVNVVDPCDVTNSAPNTSFVPLFYAWTNMPDPNSITNLSTNGPPVLATNHIFNQAVFVTVSDPNIVAQNPFITGSGTNKTTNALIEFASTGNPTNLFQTVSVWLHSTNATDLYVIDTLGSLTNRGVNLNASGLIPGANPLTPCTAPTFRPANYTVERVDNAFANGSPGNVTPPPANFLYDAMSFSNVTVAGNVAAYEAYVDDIGYDPSWESISNLPGRIIIQANNLDLTRTVIQNSGPYVSIQAKNITGSSGAVITCQNINLNIGSSNGTANILNLVTNGSLPALHGTVSLWSALWTNYMTVPHLITTPTNSFTTNTVTEMDFHVLLVDGTGLSTTVPVTVQNLFLQTNAVISDSMTVGNSFLFNGTRLSLLGNLAFSASIPEWNSSIAPSLLYFTNSGSLSIPGDAHFGDDTPNGYLSFVNTATGSISVNGGEIIKSAYFQDNGTDTAYGDYSVTATTGVVQNAAIFSTKDVTFNIGSFQIATSLVFSQGALNLDGGTSISDNGLADILVCYNGFNLFTSPQTGSLSASTITDVVASNTVSSIGPEIEHAWSGVDGGPSSAGTANNVAIGTLSLVSQAPSQIPTFHFSGTSGNNAMYVKTLDLSQLGATAANITSFIQIDPGMKIYFASANLGFTPPGNQTAVAFLQAQFPNQFVYDANAGQSVGGKPSIVISGAARRSSGSFVLTWNSASGSTYSVFRSHGLVPSTGWSAIVTNYPPGGAVGGSLSFTDTTATINPAFYRVMAEPPATQ